MTVFLNEHRRRRAQYLLVNVVPTAPNVEDMDKAAEVAVEQKSKSRTPPDSRPETILIVGGPGFQFLCAAGAPVFPFLERLEYHLESNNKAVSLC